LARHRTLAASLCTALFFLIGFVSFLLAPRPAALAQMQPQITVPIPQSTAKSRSTLEIGPATAPQKPHTVVDETLSRKATAYLHHHRLPYVNAQVFTDEDGTPDSVVLTGQVRTAFGKQDAETKVRDALRVSTIAISNQIQIGRDLSAGGPSLAIQQGGCAATAFGNTCAPSSPGSKAHAFLYRLTPVPNPRGLQGLSGTVNLIKSSNRILQLEFYTNEINVPDRAWTRGFPGYPDLNSWFGVCYDGGFDITEAGAYVIVTIADDGVAVWIDDTLVNDNEDFLGKGRFASRHRDIESGPYFSAGPGLEAGIASKPIYLAAGSHDVVVKYWQGWPSYLGVRVWAIPSSRFSTSRGQPRAADLMQLVGPPNGTLKCPH